MNIYLLKTKTGDVINKCSAKYYEEAIEYFATIKNLSTTDLLNIYTVEPE